MIKMGCKRNVLPFLRYKLGFVLVLAALSHSKPTRANTKPTAERKVDASKIPGFISINCGAAEDYNDPSSGLLYRSDVGFIDSGINHNISAQHSRNSDKWGIDLRSFPIGTRNCYKIWAENATNNDYLIRAGFLYGNYDNRSQIPIFDLYIGVDKWATMKLDNSSNYIRYEIIHAPTTDYIDICLVNTGQGVPFISFLELRPLGKSLYQTGFGSLHNARRYTFGASNRVRYPDDVYDRIWTPKVYPGWEPLSCAAPCKIKSDNGSYKLPKMVLGSAVQPLNDSYLNYDYTTGNVTEQYVFYLHFADLAQHTDGELRKLDVNINGEYNGNVTVEYLKPKTIPSPLPISGATLNVRISASGDSNLPPIVNALEVFQVMLLNNTPTALVDVVAMKDIKGKYALTRNWHGDPCLPTNYRWEGLDCRYDHPPRITSLNLSSSGLKAGNIAASISKLTALKSVDLSNNKLSGQLPESLAEMSSLEVLDLSNNKLSGQLPEFLAEIPSLRVLNLSDNNFTGSVPTALKQKWRDGKLVLSLAGNPSLPWSEKLIKRKNSVAAVAASSTVALLVLIVISAVLIFWNKKRKARMNFQRREITTEPTTRGLFMEKGRQFSYSELLRITKHFSTIIGGGGFGNVYYGNLDGGTQVAVKLLSQSSKQGYREFHAEAQLLLMVHHRNLVSLLGHCIDGETMALIYEYMANGNLQQHLSDRNTNILQWHQRLQIALDAGQGLEYLHKGCKPPIVHRDLKPSNILLDEKMQAKIADFGLSRAFGSETASHVSTGVAGTLGYLAPEVHSSGNFNQKTDVYSFGIVLLELITGQPALLKRPAGNIPIPQWIVPIVETGDIRDIVDPRLQGNFDHNSAWKAVEIAISCVPLSPVERPDIRQIVTELTECLATHLMTHQATQTIAVDSEVPEAR